MSSFTKKSEVINEIITTEEGYVEKLINFVDVYIKGFEMMDSPIKEEFMNNPMIARLFGNFQQIAVINNSFLQELHKIISEEKEEELGKLFLSYVPLFKIYGYYAANQSSSQYLIRNYMNNPTFIKEIHNYTTNPKTPQAMESYLISPTQRIPRYQLLLTSLIKYIKSDEKCYGTFENAKGMIINLCNHINEVIRETENVNLLNELQRKFSNYNDIVHKNRNLIKQGSIYKFNRRGNKTKYEFFLFNDCIIYAEVSGAGYYYHRQLSIDGMYISNIKDLTFDLNTLEKSFTLIFESNEELDTWRKLMEETSKKFNKTDSLNYPNPEDVDISKYVRCLLCGKSFSLINKKNLCYRCCKAVCNKCLSKDKVLVKSINSKEPIKLCNPCMSIEMEEKENSFELEITSAKIENITNEMKEKHNNLYLSFNNGMCDIGTTLNKENDKENEWNKISIKDEIELNELNDYILIIELYNHQKIGSDKLIGIGKMKLEDCNNGNYNSKYYSEQIVELFTVNQGHPTKVQCCTVLLFPRLNVPIIFQKTVEPYELIEKYMNILNLECSYINIVVKEIFRTIYNRKNIDLPRMQSIHRLEDEYLYSKTNMKQFDNTINITGKGKNLRDLIKTEIEYVKNLKLLNTIFVEPLHHLDLEVNETFVKLRTMSKCKYVKVKGLNNPDIAVFMECIDELIVMSNKLIDDLNELCKNSYDNVNVGPVFLSYIPLLRVYSMYMSTLPGLKTILNCDENINFYESIKNHPLCEIDFELLINKPLERLTDYQEIISKIIIDDESSNTSDEKEQLRKAKQEIGDLVNNSKMSRRLTHKLIDEIKNELFNSGIKLDDGNRDFIKAGTLVTFTPSKLVEYKYYLFSDILIYGKPYLGKVIQPKKLYLKDCDVDSCNYSFRDRTNLFIIKSKDNSFYVSANSLEEKISWIEEIRKYIYQQRNENNIDSTNIYFAPILQLEEVVSVCELCHSVFSWSNKKIHCLNCGNIFCKNCTNYSAAVPYSNDSIAKTVCKKCFEELLNEIQIENGSHKNSERINKKHLSLRQPPTLSIEAHNSNSCPSFSSNPSSPSTIRKTKSKKSCDDLLVDALQEILIGDKMNIFNEINTDKEKRISKRMNKKEKIDFSELEKESKKNKNNSESNEDDPFSCLIKPNGEKSNPANDLSAFDDLFK